nr:uncharacterized protein I303_03187 [Kwoniella dejecticola CBS 10117]OBR87163.1 hypothetical protein I303_03187 [Kwoniella dejecticola CBS 10117]
MPQDVDRLRSIVQESADQQVARVLEKVRQHRHHIIQDIQSLRPSHVPTLHIPDTFDTLKASKWYSCFNVHFLISFEDNVKWLLRVRINDGREMPHDLVYPSIRSEVATLNVLKSHGVPVPTAWLPPHMQERYTGQEAPNIDYFFYDFLPGKAQEVPIDGYFGPINLPEDKIDQLVENYVKSQTMLSEIKLPCKQIGCLKISSTLDPAAEVIEVGPIIQQGTFMRPTAPHFLGPFDTLKEMYTAHIDATLHYISINGLRDKFQVDDYLWHLELRELVSCSKVLGETPDQLYIKHLDPSGTHLMVDENGYLSGILDWEWARVTTKADAFSDGLFRETEDFFWRGDNSLTDMEERVIDCYNKHGRPDLAECVTGSRLYHRLASIGRYDPARHKSGYREVFKPDLPEDFDPPPRDADWRVYMMQRYRANEGLQEVMQKYGWNIERAEEVSNRARGV